MAVLLAGQGGCMKDVEEEAAAASGHLVLNELQASNSSGPVDEQGEHDDWVELHNPTGQALALDGLALSDDPGDPAKHVIAGTDSLVPPGGHVVIWCDDATPPGPFHAAFKLSADGETLVLSDASGRRLDERAFGPQASDQSEGRLPDGWGAWEPLASPTPGMANSEDSLPEPGRLLINEFLASNNACCVDEHGEHDDWIELFNAGGESVELDGLWISDDAQEPEKGRIPLGAGLSLAPGAFVVVWCDNQTAQGPLHMPFALSAGGEQIVLSGADGNVLDQLEYPAQVSDVSRGRTPDGGASWQDFSTPTPGAANRP